LAELLSEYHDTMTTVREYYRIRYPASECPFVIWNGHRVPVIDLSETGIHFSIINLPQELVARLAGENQQAVIQFKNGDEHATRFSLVRTMMHSMAVTLLKPVPFDQILSEQRRLRIRFRHAGNYASLRMCE
jgi:hypothetical protein